MKAAGKGAKMKGKGKTRSAQPEKASPGKKKPSKGERAKSKSEKVPARRRQPGEKGKVGKEQEKTRRERARESWVEWKGKVQAEAKTSAAQRDSLIAKLQKDLADKETVIRQSEKTLKEAIGMAGKEVAGIREKTNQTLSEWRGKAEAEYKKLREELEKKSQALAEKSQELEECKKNAERKIAQLQAKAPKEIPGKMITEEKERTGLVTFKGNPMTLVGEEVKVGERAPDFQVVDTAMQPASLGSFKGKVKIISSVPSLDTPVCDMETRRFNEEAGKLPENAALLTVSMDLPFAQKRWCAAAGVEKVKTFSDFQNRSFGCAWGVLIKELKLLARAVFVVDDQDVVRYVEIVPEITQEPDYNRALEAARTLI
jgi:thioredoxin-dependent peroxiredoxin